MAAGCILWVLTFLAVLFLCGRRFRPSTVILGAILGVAGILLYFRPHEDIFGGQDQGAYLNVAATYARDGRVLYTDPLLAQIPPGARRAFLYRGHGSDLVTPLHVFALRDVRTAQMGPIFQPAYPLLLSVAARIGDPAWVLYVTPLFVLLAALAIGVLARETLDSALAGCVAAALFLFNPLVAWHGRCARAEIVAVFFLAAGTVFLLRAARGGLRAAAYAVAAALCFGLAPFFHVTAWLAAVVAAVLVGALILRGRTDLLAYLPVAGSGVLVFLAQTHWIVDNYGLGRWVDALAANWAVAVAGIGAFLAGGTAIWIFRRRKAPSGGSVNPRADRNASMAVAFLSVVLLAAAWCACGAGQRVLFRVFLPVRALAVADVRGFVTLVSWPVAVVGLAGWLLFVLRSGETRRVRRLAALVLLPGFALGGLGIGGYMYDARYMIPFLVPALVLGCAAAVTCLGGGGRWRWLVAGLAVVLVFLGTRDRAHLYRMVEYRGFAGYLESVAQTVRRANGLALIEYSRIAAPLHHLFGVPALGLDNERNLNYTRAEWAWARILRNHPDRKAFFLTPSGGRPASERFVFEPVGDSAYAGQRLLPDRGGVPAEAVVWGCRMRVYRMSLREACTSVWERTSFPVSADFASEGNMGLHRFQRSETCRGVRVAVRVLRKDAPLRLDIPVRRAAPSDAGGPAPGRDSRTGEVWFVCGPVPAEGPPLVRARAGDAEAPVRWARIGEAWWLGRVRCGGSGAGVTAELAADADTPLCMARWICGDEAISLFDAWKQPDAADAEAPAFGARWGTAGADFVIPMAPGRATGLCAFLVAPMEAGNDSGVRFSIAGTPGYAERRIPTGRYVWEVWPQGIVCDAPCAKRFVLSSDKADDPATMRQTGGLVAAMAEAVVVGE